MKKIENVLKNVSAKEVKAAAKTVEKVKKQYSQEGHVCRVHVRPLRMVAFDQK
tara:strand:+ start:85787 stop:85945 length:159 start_codon:yes stop_codon:yes gene_type:complete